MILNKNVDMCIDSVFLLYTQMGVCIVRRRDGDELPRPLGALALRVLSAQGGLGALEDFETFGRRRSPLQPTRHLDDASVRKLDREVVVVRIHADLVALALEIEIDPHDESCFHAVQLDPRAQGVSRTHERPQAPSQPGYPDISFLK